MVKGEASLPPIVFAAVYSSRPSKALHNALNHFALSQSTRPRCSTSTSAGAQPAASLWWSFADVVTIFLVRTVTHGLDYSIQTWPCASDRERRIGSSSGDLSTLLFRTFPVFSMTLAAFKTEIAAVSHAAAVCSSRRRWRTSPTVRSRADYPVFALNSIVISRQRDAGRDRPRAARGLRDGVSIPSKRTKDLLLWMLSTKMMPAIGVLIPIYLAVQRSAPARHDLRPDHHLHP